jgi:type I restriction enzyme S subunit
MVKTPLVQIGDCAKVVNGFAFKSELFTTERKGLPVVRIRDVVRGRTETYYTGEYPDSAVIRNGDLLVGMDGEFNIARWQGGTALLNQRVCKIEARAGVSDIAYLRHALAIILKRVEHRTPFATVKHLSSEELKEETVLLPNLLEQQRIAEQLEQADRLRRTRRYALEISDIFLPAAFLEVFGDPTTNPLGLPVAELGDFLSFVTSGSRGWAEYYSPVGARFIRSLDVRMNNISDENAAFVKAPNGAEADRTRVKYGDVLLTITGSRIGRVAPVPERLDGAFISQHVAILRLEPGILPEFLSMFLSLGPGGQRQIARLQYSQTKPGLNLDQIREMRVPVPHVSQQQQFLALAKRVERLRAVQREALRQAEHFFQTLLHLAFSETNSANCQGRSGCMPQEVT